MKLKLKISILALIIYTNLSATVITVNNTLTGAGQFTQIDPAITSAAAGDTIYVSGSASAYNNCTITKSITLLGPGTFSSKQNSFPASIGEITFSSNVSNVTIAGFKITNSIYVSKFTVSLNSNINNVTIRNNSFPAGAFGLYFNALSNSSNFLISGNILGSVDFSMNPNPNVSNITLENNIINGYINSLVCNNSLISNNVFYNNSNAFNATITNATIQNNIFYNAHPSNFTSGCTFLNNLTYSTSLTYPTLSGTGNIDNVNPLFINVGTTGGYVATYDFRLQNSSPGHNAGNDGKDLGIYGGSAFVALSGETYNMPVVRQMTITNTNVSQNGNLNVNVRSTKSR
ncbi:MAG TPA: hypothetical protein PLI68_00490 [Bacteroidia bacterium]|nr:hypothetical protein [Bacteroidia bacterium]HRH08069.1 hypothetical protein [Bacteroidia bacterium]HRH61777.1 hypothetical protein [Bacteroidia bacterium]